MGVWVEVGEGESIRDALGRLRSLPLTEGGEDVYHILAAQAASGPLRAPERDPPEAPAGCGGGARASPPGRPTVLGLLLQPEAPAVEAHAPRPVPDPNSGPPRASAFGYSTRFSFMSRPATFQSWT